MRQVTEYVDWEAYAGTGEDAHGDEVDQWADPVSVGIYAFDPGSSSEPREPGHDRVIVQPTLYVPADVVFGAKDRVTVRGKTYDVDGETREWRNPDGSRPGNVITLRRAGEA